MRTFFGKLDEDNHLRCMSIAVEVNEGELRTDEIIFQIG